MDEEDWDYEIQKTPETDADDAAKETPTDTAEVKSAPEETAKPEPAEESTDEEQSLPANSSRRRTRTGYRRIRNG